MALVVEDGTGLANANAYISESFADTYHSDRGNAAWGSLSSTVKEQLIIKATEYLDATYDWIGQIKSDDQALGWPRKGDVKDKDGRDLKDQVPTAVKRACAELALIGNDGSLVENTDRSSFVTKEKVDVLEVEYSSSAPTSTQYNYVNRLLYGLYGGGEDLERD